MFAADGPERLVGPLVGQDRVIGEAALGEEPDIAALERMRLQLATRHAAVEDQRVERDTGEAQPEAVQDGDGPDHLTVDGRSPRGPPS